jgi:hypothetical protein
LCFSGFRPGSRSTFLSGKVDKTIDAPSGYLGWDGRQHSERGTNSLRSNKACRLLRASDPEASQQASETNAHHTMEKVADMRCIESAEQMESCVFA